MNIRTHIVNLGTATQNRETIETIAQFLYNKKVTLFTGAGISRPSGLPLSGTFIKNISETMCEAIRTVNLGTNKEQHELERVLPLYPLEKLLDSLVNKYGEDALKILTILESGFPNYNHSAIAQLAKNDYLDTIITLNFDVLFENALLASDISFTWNLPLSSVKQEFLGSDKNVTLIKPHGTLPVSGYPYKSYYLAATLSQCGDRPRPENAKSFKSTARIRPVLIVAGYSNNDWDISPLLRTTDWSHIIWIEHFKPKKNSDVPSPEKPCQYIQSWLENHPASWLIYGDVKDILRQLLKIIGINSDYSQNTTHQLNSRDAPELKPEVKFLLDKPEAVAFSAISLLDGKFNDLYESLLFQLGELSGIHNDNRLSGQWDMAMAWYYHAQHSDIRKSSNIRRKLLPALLNQDRNNEIDLLGNYLSIHYDHLATFRRPYLNPFFIYDLFMIFKYKRKLFELIKKIKSTKPDNPWIIAQANKHEALAKYHIVDLIHKWGYHFLPFENRRFRIFTKWLFRRISLAYGKLFESYPMLNWEYPYVRYIESMMIADCIEDREEIMSMLQKNLNMFERTGLAGHHAYAMAVHAIINNDRKTFNKSFKLMVDENNITTPGGKLRMILFKRYFWPDSISLVSVIKDSFKYSKIIKS